MKNKNKIKIKVNGKNLSIDQNSTVFSFMPLNKVAIELNEKIIDKKKLRNITLKNKDILEIVHFIGGG